MPRQSPGFTAVGGYDIDVEVSGVLTTEGNPFSVRRKMWIRCLALKTCDAACVATGTRNGPNIVGIRKGDLRCAYRWCAQQPCAGRLRCSIGPNNEDANDGGGEHE